LTAHSWAALAWIPFSLLRYSPLPDRWI